MILRCIRNRHFLKLIYKNNKKVCPYRNYCDNNSLGSAYVPSKLDSLKYEKEYFTSTQKNANFTLLLPPPNITGNLHLGHALTVTIQDVLVRWHKMRGYKTLWIPGMDHAGIATQVIVEKKLLKEKGKTRHEIGREQFLEAVFNWKEEKLSVIEMQLKKLDCSLNWDRKFFTMDKNCCNTVNEAFIELFKRRLIYRTDYLVNWSCALQSAISDIEVDYLEVSGETPVSVPSYEKPVIFGKLTKFAYKLHENDEEIVVATTRPETILGDVAVAVNPNDNRYSNLIGKKLIHPFRNDLIPIISDDFVDPQFGTGAVKITPSHDHKDFEASKRHNLPTIQVIDKTGRLTDNCGAFAGLKRFEARDVILDELAKRNLLRGSQDHKMLVPVCSRSGDIVEYLAVPQWFVNCREMAERALTDFQFGRLEIEPDGFGRMWLSWLENIKDWCISRQLWWGHRIPVYLCWSKKNPKETKWIAANCYESALKEAAEFFSAVVEDVEIKQDEDVLDTWFSSALLPFSVFGWPEKTVDFKKLYPLSLMETGHDILFFWVARMVMLGTELTGQLPFKKILLHGVICDAFGRKMSKSLGNVVAPEEVISGATLKEMENKLKANFEAGILSKEELEKASNGQKKMFPDGIPECGSDALRFTLCSHNVKNHFINFDVRECLTNKLFCNKIWQATKFTNLWLKKVAEIQTLKTVGLSDLSYIDQWILSRLSLMVDEVNYNLHNNNLHNVTAAIKKFLYYEFCDVYLEAIKRGVKAVESEAAVGHCWTLVHCLDTSLLCLAPFMPILSQHLHRSLPEHPAKSKTISFPEDSNFRNVMLEVEIDSVLNVVVGLRRLKTIFNITAKHKPKAYLITDEAVYNHFSQMIQDLSKCYELHVTHFLPYLTDDTFCDSVDGKVKVHLVIPNEVKEGFLVDVPKLEKKRVKVETELNKIKKMMSAENYKVKATQSEQELHYKKVISLEEKLTRMAFIQQYSNQGNKKTLLV